eukprot:CAMPEP_0114615192 /NCGR_PEP_ID=MMETSP0168-20121206/6039_1 /TAXON_ID=95228 ORGANISM="Vannella sp., Strain DIVA3 517/6/12" /NCGR_SAMPLE_ID=MMETSP0168 /ASSEMBLY_ACC=CAM_ASM_000044 /LENGTH=467 /DNA_ID=CAMNT_0001826257 /DNA_START=199 /DNA_END=1602 /DNA_ORIENTATION=+
MQLARSRLVGYSLAPGRRCVLCTVTGARCTSTAATKKTHMPRKYWESEQNQRAFMEEVARKVGINTSAMKLSDWDALSNEELRRLGGASMLNRYGGSVYRLLCTLYPRLAEEAPAKSRRKLPNGYWNVRENRQKLFNEIAAAHGVETDQDWRRVLTKDVVAAGGAGLLKLYGNSVFAALVGTFPDKEWNELEVRSTVPKGYWLERDNRKKFLESFKRKWRPSGKDGTDAEPALHLDRSVWQQVEGLDILALPGGASFLKHYGYSLLRALRDLEPEHTWNAEDVSASKKPKHFWKDAANLRRFLDTLAEAKGIKSPMQWKDVKNSDVIEGGGYSLFEHHGTLFNALQAAYPEQEFFVDQCRPSVPRSHWQDEGNVRDFIARVSRSLRIEGPADWARVSHQQLRELGGGSLLASMTLANALEIADPDGGPWNFVSERTTSQPGRCNQRGLAVAIANLLGASQLQRGAST